MEPATRKRLSRWSNDPIILSDGSAKAVHPTRRDIEIFTLLSSYRYLRADFIHAFIGGSLQGLTARLNELCRAPNCFLSRPQAQRQFANANYRYLIYELAPRGEQLLLELGRANPMAQRIGDERQFAHSMMINDTLASIELGVRARTGLRIVPWSEILGRTTFPQRDTALAHTLPVDISHTFEAGKTHHAKFNYTNDCHGPFGIEYGGNRPSWRFFCLEAEHRNMLERTNLDQASFLKKVRAIEQIQRDELYRSQWGVPNLFHLFVVPSQARIESMKAKVLGWVGPSKFILFRTIPVMADVEKAAHPDPTFLGPWQRAGFDALDISKSEGR